MKIVVEDSFGGKKKEIYEKEVPDEFVIDKITSKSKPSISFWYILIDGKLFRSQTKKGKFGGYLFQDKNELDHILSEALYWHRDIITNIGCAVGYDTEKFLDELKSTHKVEYKEVVF